MNTSRTEMVLMLPISPEVYEEIKKRILVAEPYVVIATEVDVSLATVYNVKYTLEVLEYDIPEPRRIDPSITKRQVDLMRLMVRKGRRVKDLAAALDVTSSTISGILATLRSRALVAKRGKRWELTPLGRAELATSHHLGCGRNG
jgi:DNA-binding NarL/FixJ family response regulator